MRRLLSSFTAAGLAGAILAQAPAPDFQIGINNLSLNSFDATFRVQGPPNSPFTMLFTLDNPFLTMPPIVTPLYTGQLDAAGFCTLPLGTIPWQGPLPDIWFGVVLFQPVQPPVIVDIAHVAGSLAFLAVPNSANTNTWNAVTGRLQTKVKTDPNTTVSIWKAPCGLLPAYPAVGQPFNVAQSGVTYVGGGVTDSNGNLTWSGTITPDNCVVVMANGVIIGVKREL